MAPGPRDLLDHELSNLGRQLLEFIDVEAAKVCRILDVFEKVHVRFISVGGGVGDNRLCGRK